MKDSRCSAGLKLERKSWVDDQRWEREAQAWALAFQRALWWIQSIRSFPPQQSRTIIILNLKGRDTDDNLELREREASFLPKHMLMLGNGERAWRFLRNNALRVRQRACLCVEGTWSLKRIIDQAAAARGSNRKAEQKSNLHLVAMHCGKNQWQSDRLGVVLTLDAPGRKGRLCVWECERHWW